MVGLVSNSNVTGSRLLNLVILKPIYEVDFLLCRLWELRPRRLILHSLSTVFIHTLSSVGFLLVCIFSSPSLISFHTLDEW